MNDDKQNTIQSNTADNKITKDASAEILEEEQANINDVEQVGESASDTDHKVAEENTQDVLQERLAALEEALAQEKKRSKSNHNDYLRAMADMDNLRKRTEREKERARKFALETFCKDLLTLADNIDRAIVAIRKNQKEIDTPTPLMKSLVKGTEMIEGELQRTLNKHGVEKIKAQGNAFNPNFHQAMTQVEDTEVESGCVVQELQTGYMLNGRLLRPAMVTVAK
ncbi:nucleotide exchange factor GrpE [Magnetococcales bacterium HHB-1]